MIFSNLFSRYNPRHFNDISAKNKNFAHTKNVKGITLVALVVTILVLLILAGVTIMTLFGENGLITMAQKAKSETENAQANAIAGLGSLANEMNSILNGNGNALNPDDGTTPVDGDVYTAGNYKYTYYSSDNGWYVEINEEVTDYEQSTYGPILESINGQPVTNMEFIFEACSNLTTAPAIPSGVTNISCAFLDCTSLTTAPAIPAGITDMNGVFSNCSSLATAPAIPAGITNMCNTFLNCTSLTTAPAIPAEVTNMQNTFQNCTSLTTAPKIPAGVMVMNGAFSGCTALTGEISIPCSLASQNYAYENCPATVAYYHVDGCDGSCGK